MTSDEKQAVEQLHVDVMRRREEAQRVAGLARPVNPFRKSVLDKIIHGSFGPPPDAAAVELETRRRAEATRQAAHRRFIVQVGQAYAACTLASFEASGPEQQRVVTVLQRFVDDLLQHFARGTGLLFYGPCGAGKDHLATAVCKAAIDRGVGVEWVNGMSLFADLRRSFDSDSRGYEQAIVYRYGRTPLLYLSDPTPPAGELTSFQADALLRIIDKRYRLQLPTIVTANVPNATEAEALLTAPVYDRLRERSLPVKCEWASFRLARRPSFPATRDSQTED